MPAEKKESNLRQQSALEFIMTYSWAILIISLFVVMVIIITGSRPPAAYLGSSCSIQPLFPCLQSTLIYNAINPLQYYVVFNNEIGSVLYFPANSINVTTIGLGSSGLVYNLGNCNPTYASPGVSVLCEANVPGSVKPADGSQTSLAFTISYGICETASNGINVCTGGTYKSSGSSAQTLEPSTLDLASVTFNDMPYNSGTIVINGQTFFNNTMGYFQPGNYVVYANPRSAYGFNQFTINANNAFLANAMNQTTTLTLNIFSNAIITANNIYG